MTDRTRVLNAATANGWTHTVPDAGASHLARDRYTVEVEWDRFNDRLGWAGLFVPEGQIAESDTLESVLWWFENV